jgi:hypothetical protein
MAVPLLQAGRLSNADTFGLLRSDAGVVVVFDRWGTPIVRSAAFAVDGMVVTVVFHLSPVANGSTVSVEGTELLSGLDLAVPSGPWTIGENVLGASTVTETAHHLLIEDRTTNAVANPPLGLYRTNVVNSWVLGFDEAQIVGQDTSGFVVIETTGPNPRWGTGGSTSVILGWGAFLAGVVCLGLLGLRRWRPRVASGLTAT